MYVKSNDNRYILCRIKKENVWKLKVYVEFSLKGFGPCIDLAPLNPSFHAPFCVSHNALPFWKSQATPFSDILSYILDVKLWHQFVKSSFLYESQKTRKISFFSTFMLESRPKLTRLHSCYIPEQALTSFSNRTTRNSEEPIFVITKSRSLDKKSNWTNQILLIAHMFTI